MSIFQVKDWDLPSKPIASDTKAPRKRKRSASGAADLDVAEQNVNKLMKIVKKGTLGTKSPSEKKHPSSIDSSEKLRSDKRTRASKRSKALKSPKEEIKQGLIKNKSKNALNTTSPKLDCKKQHTVTNGSNTSPSFEKLTSLQASMKNTLEGARFRWINEVLYSTSSVDGYKLMRDDPKVFEEYHLGFRKQVRSWPINPVNHYISILSSYSTGIVIADLGCGDATLAQALVPKGYCVLSYDLVSKGAYILEADICRRIPLPGSEEPDEGQVVDICVCALSLMSLDWLGCIRETWRILKKGGELKIAEVTSRLTDVDGFIELVKKLGFKFISKDDSNTHFMLFEFCKTSREPLSDRVWENLQAKRNLLKPCEYKRR